MLCTALISVDLSTHHPDLSSMLSCFLVPILQAGVFAIPLLNREQLAKLRGMILDIPRINDSVCKSQSSGSCLLTQAARHRTGYCRRGGKEVRM